MSALNKGILTSDWTTAYREVGDSVPVFLPVRISVGLPRYWSRAKAFPYLKLLAPVGLRALKGAPFDEAYLKRLDEIGVDAIEAQFERLYDEYQKPLVLLCFETIEDKGDDDFDRACHRRTFARWWRDRAGGYVIREAQGLNPRALRRQLR